MKKSINPLPMIIAALLLFLISCDAAPTAEEKAWINSLDRTYTGLSQKISIMELLYAVIEDPTWTASAAKGEITVKVKGRHWTGAKVEMNITLTEDLTYFKIKPLRINNVIQSDESTVEFLTDAYVKAFPDSKKLMGVWDSGILGEMHINPDHTLMRNIGFFSVTGQFTVDEQKNVIVVNADTYGPMIWQYTFINEDTLTITADTGKSMTYTRKTK